MLKNMKIGTRLTLAFMIVLAILVAVSAVSAISLLQMTDADHELYEKNTVGIMALGNVQYDFMSLRMKSYQAIYVSDTEYAQKASDLKTAHDDYFEKIAGYMKLFEGTTETDSEQAEYSELQALITQYKTSYEDIINAVGSGNDGKITEAIKPCAEVADKLNAKLLEVVADRNVQAKNRADSNAAIAQTSLIVAVALALTGIFISIALSLVITRSITKPVQKLLTGANGLAAGDMTAAPDAAGKDEIGQLAESLSEVFRAVSKLTQDINYLVEAAQNGRLEARADPSGHKGEYMRIIAGFNGTLEAIVEPVKEAVAVLKKTSANDLSERMQGEYKGELQVIADAVNGSIDHSLAIQRVFVDLSKGDLSQLSEYERIGKRSENDQMIPAILKTMHTLNGLINDANMLSEEAVNGNLDVRGDTAKYEGKYRQLLSGINNIIDAMVTPMNEAIGVLNTMAGNDLTGRMSGGYNGAFSDLSNSINSVLETLNQMLSDINASSEQVAAGTQQVSAGSQALSQGATEQASAIEELTSALTEIAGQTRQNAVNAGQASELAVAAKESAMAGNAQMNELQQAMSNINDASANISKIIKVIDEIAFQTNLLALNAAVEAARAGQHGKGFAVVAEEVRSLAQRSASAAKETTEMIESSIKMAKAGTLIANETAGALLSIVGSVEKVAGLIEGIAKASNDQAMAVAQVNGGIEQVAQVTQTNSATAEESAAASEELTGQAVMLKEMVGRFELSGISAPALPQLKQTPKVIPAAKPSVTKPKISLSDTNFGKY